MDLLNGGQYGCWKNCCLVVGWLLVVVVVVAGGRWVGTGGMFTLRILEKNVNKSEKSLAETSYTLLSMVCTTFWHDDIRSQSWFV